MGEITQLLEGARQGDDGARAQLFARMYADLDRLARAKLARESPLTMLDAPGLVHEVYLQVVDSEVMPGRNRAAFMAYAACVMRSVIVDYIRSRKADRHGGGQKKLTLNTGIANQVFTDPELESLGDALESLQQIDERAHRIVEMRYFGGMEIEEIAEHLTVSPATVKRDWTKARLFLRHQMSGGAGSQ